MRPSHAFLAAALLLGACNPAGADPCAPPPEWTASVAKAGHPDQNLAACLLSEAYKVRTLRVPLESAAHGITAICEIEVDRLEHATLFNDPAKDKAVLQQATAAVSRYRSCPTR